MIEFGLIYENGVFKVFGLGLVFFKIELLYVIISGDLVICFFDI